MYMSFLYSNHRHGDTRSVTVPARFEVCPECNGTGKVLCDGLRGVAFSSEEMSEDPDFSESYFGGHYDVQCDQCNGRNVVKVADEERMSKRQLLLWNLYQDQQSEREYSRSYERRMRERGVQY